MQSKSGTDVRLHLWRMIVRAKYYTSFSALAKQRIFEAIRLIFHRHCRHHAAEAGRCFAKGASQ